MFVCSPTSVSSSVGSEAGCGIGLASEVISDCGLIQAGNGPEGGRVPKWGDVVNVDADISSASGSPIHTGRRPEEGRGCMGGDTDTGGEFGAGLSSASGDPIHAGRRPEEGRGSTGVDAGMGGTYVGSSSVSSDPIHAGRGPAMGRGPAETSAGVVEIGIGPCLDSDGPIQAGRGPDGRRGRGEIADGINDSKEGVDIAGLSHIVMSIWVNRRTTGSVL